MLFKIQHITRYRYDRPVYESANQIKIYPLTDGRQEIVKQELNITGDQPIHVFTDYFGNTAGHFTLSEPHRELAIDSKLVVRTILPPETALDRSHPLEWEQFAAAVRGDVRLLDLSKAELKAAKNDIQRATDELMPLQDAPALFVQRCSEFVYAHFTYQKGITTVETTVAEIWTHRRGVCQDFAHVLLEMLRSAGIPSRYVSGYICPNSSGVRGAGATHAWVEAWLPTCGWVGIDPTNNCWVSDTHVALATGRHFDDCSPVKGTFKGPANQELSIYVSVGFEDGRTFEDINLVQLTKEPTKLAAVDMGAGQQQ